MPPTADAAPMLLAVQPLLHPGGGVFTRYLARVLPILLQLGVWVLQNWYRTAESGGVFSVPWRM